MLDTTSKGRPPKLIITSDGASLTPSTTPSAKKTSKKKKNAEVEVKQEQDTGDEYGTVTIEKGRIVGEITLGLLSDSEGETGGGGKGSGKKGGSKS